MPEIITRAEAKAQGLKRFFTGEPCKRGHVAERFTSSKRCYECQRESFATPEARAWHRARDAKRYATPEARARKRATFAKYIATPEGRAMEKEKRARRCARYLSSKLTDADAELKTWLDLDAKDQAERARKKVQKYRDLLAARLLKWEGQEAVDAQLATWAAASSAESGGEYPSAGVSGWYPKPILRAHFRAGWTFAMLKPPPCGA